MSQLLLGIPAERHEESRNKIVTKDAEVKEFGIAGEQYTSRFPAKAD
jgi:hypothetical protein